MTERPRRIDGLKIEEVDDGFIVYQPSRDRVHYLNHTAALILELCDGQHTPTQIAELVRQMYALPEPPAQEVGEILDRARDEGLMEQDHAGTPGGGEADGE